MSGSSTGRGRWGGTQLYSALAQSSALQWEALPDLTGTSVGGYQIVRELGRGGMGVVYLAEHPIIHTRVAVKLLRPELARRPEIAQRFFNEARAVALIEHANSVRIFDLTTLPSGQPCIVMELVEGARLDELLTDRPMAVDRTVRILMQICDALTAAHKHGIVHRDVKPQNVLLVNGEGRKDFVKLLDFGLAKIGDDLEGGHRPGTLVGTPRYMAPEQIRGEYCDARTDIYAVGVLAYEMLSGLPPFDGESPEEITFKHLTEDPNYLDQFPQPVNAVLDKALAKSPADRYDSAAEFCRAFADAVKAAPPAVAGPATAKKAEPPARPPFDNVVRKGGPADARLPAPPADQATDLDMPAVKVQEAPLPPPPAPPPTPVPPPRTVRGPSPSPPPPPPENPFAREFGADWMSRLEGNHYGFLGIPLDANDESILAGTRRWDVALSSSPSRGQTEQHPYSTVRSRLGEARRTLLNPARRALYDAEIRNMLGVAQALTSGLGPMRFRSLHEQFAQQFPERVRTAQRLGTEATRLRQGGQLADALKLLDDALEEDPLSLPLHQQSFDLRRQLSTGAAQTPTPRPAPPASTQPSGNTGPHSRTTGPHSRK